MIDRATLERAARQHGVISRRQFIDDLGHSAEQYQRTRAAGLLVPVTRRVCRVASSPESFEMRCTAVSLELGDTGFLAGWCAGKLYGLRRMPGDRVLAAVPHGRRVALPTWAQVVRTSWYSEDDVTLARAPYRLAVPLRMLFGLAKEFNQFRFERAAEDAWHRGLITPESAAQYLERHRCRGKDGVARFERWLVRALGQRRPAQSGLEQRLLDAIARVGLPPPERQYPLQLLDGETVHLDIAWPRRRLAVEPGASWWHGGDLRQRLDQARDVACGEVGWQVVRFDETLLANPLAAARRVSAVYRARPMTA